MTDKERIAALRQALIAARYEIVYWANRRVYLSKKDKDQLDAGLAHYDEIINTELAIV